MKLLAVLLLAIIAIVAVPIVFACFYIFACFVGRFAMIIPIILVTAGLFAMSWNPQKPIPRTVYVPLFIYYILVAVSCFFPDDQGSFLAAHYWSAAMFFVCVIIWRSSKSIGLNWKRIATLTFIAAAILGLTCMVLFSKSN